MSVLTTIPDVQVLEEWNFLTDVIRTRNGKESRLSLRENPRLSLTGNFPVITQAKRSVFTQYIFNNLDVVNVVPNWPYLSRLTADASAAATTILFDVSRVPVAVGGKIVLIDDINGDFQSYTVDTVTANGCTITTGLTSDVTTRYYAVLGVDCLIFADARNRIQQITNSYSIKFDSWIEPALERPGSTATLTTYDGLNVLDQRPLEGKTEVFNILKEIQDNDTGRRDLVSPEDHARIVSKSEFIVQRQTAPQDFDFWRLFFATVRGAWKPFLHPTYMNDFNLTTTLVPAGTTIVSEEIGLSPTFLGFESFKRIEIEYSDGTISRHNITNAVVSTNLTLTISPALPNDIKVENVQRISHLLKMRCADTVNLSHGSLATVISFDTVTTDEG